MTSDPVLQTCRRQEQRQASRGHANDTTMGANCSDSRVRVVEVCLAAVTFNEDLIQSDNAFLGSFDVFTFFAKPGIGNGLLDLCSRVYRDEQSSHRC